MPFIVNDALSMHTGHLHGQLQYCQPAIYLNDKSYFRDMTGCVPDRRIGLVNVVFVCKINALYAGSRCGGVWENARGAGSWL